MKNYSCYLRTIVFLLTIISFAACEKKPQMIFNPSIVFDDQCLGFKEIGNACSFYMGNYGPNFDDALDSVQKVNTQIVNREFEQLSNIADEYDFDDTTLNFEAYHVAEDDIALDRRRTYTHIVLYVLWKGNSDNSLHQPSYVPIFDYGVIDNCGDWYVCNYPPD